MRVSDVMTADVLSVGEGTALREVAGLLAKRGISGVPVCDTAGHMVGLVSEYDLIANPEARTAAEVMTRDVISVMEDTQLDDVRQLLMNRNIRRVPVLRGQALVGIVSRADLVREIALTWVCVVCGDHERGAEPPANCPRCGAESDHRLSATPPVGEGAEHPA